MQKIMRANRFITQISRATPLVRSAQLAATQPSTRSVQTLSFGGVKEIVYERADFPAKKIQTILQDDVLAVIGYGTQGQAQSLNLRDNKLRVIVGLRKDGVSWKKAMSEGWIPGKTLFSIEEACIRGTVLMNLLSDAGQKEAWPAMKPHLTKGKTLYFSHGFGLVFNDQTGIVPPKDIDVILAAPKGSGTTLRSFFLEGRGLNASIAVHQVFKNILNLSLGLFWESKGAYSSAWSCYWFWISL